MSFLMIIHSRALRPAHLSFRDIYPVINEVGHILQFEGGEAELQWARKRIWAIGNQVRLPDLLSVKGETSNAAEIALGRIIKGTINQHTSIHLFELALLLKQCNIADTLGILISFLPNI